MDAKRLKGLETIYLQRLDAPTAPGRRTQKNNRSSKAKFRVM